MLQLLLLQFFAVITTSATTTSTAAVAATELIVTVEGNWHARLHAHKCVNLHRILI